MATGAQRHLDELDERLAATARATRELTDSLEAEQLVWRPDPDRWGIADCFEHLVVADGRYLPGLRSAFDAAPPPPEHATYAPGLFARWFIRTVGPDGKLRLPAPGRFRPPPARPDAPRRFLEQQRRIARFVAEARRVDLQGARLRSPVTPLLRFTIGEALTLIVAHEERHLNQAGAVRRHPRFPS